MDSATRVMASEFAAAQKSMGSALERVASGQRFTRASQDLSGFVQLTNAEVDIAKYDRLSNSLGEYSSKVKMTLDAADSVLEDLKTVKNLAAQMTEESDANAKTALAAEIKGHLGSIVENLAMTNSDGETVLGASITGVKMVGGNTLTVTYTSGAAALPTLNTAAATTGLGTATVQTNIDNMVLYVGNVKNAMSQIESQKNMADTMLSNAEALSSSITAIDEAKEMANVVDSNIRQQAAMSMLSQANMSRQNVALLYR
jgi:flagellin